VAKTDEVKTISAPPEFWDAVDEAALMAGGIGRSAFIRLAVHGVKGWAVAKEDNGSASVRAPGK